jgi:hypothetical protein
MEPDVSWMIGQNIREVIYRDPEHWWIHFPNGGHFHIETLWRLVGKGRIVRTSYDHGHWFGLGAPVHADEHLKAYLADRQVTRVVLTECTDLVLEFGAEDRLEILYESAGYEAWSIRLPSGGWIFACSGGKLDYRGADWQGDGR